MKHLKILSIAIILIFIVGAASAVPPSVSSVTVNPHKIFKCQASTITATFNDFADITQVNLSLETLTTGRDETYNMTNTGGGIFTYTYGNDNKTVWGNKTIFFDVKYTPASQVTLAGDNYVFVYSDNCVGSNIQGSTNISIGLGHYTSQLRTSSDFLSWLLVPYIDYFGYSFFIFVMIFMMAIIYNKNQKISQIIIIGVITLITLAASGFIPDQFKVWSLMAIGAIIAAAAWKTFKS